VTNGCIRAANDRAARMPSARWQKGRRGLLARSYHAAGGSSLAELVVACAIIATVCGMTIPSVAAGVDYWRAYGAARYVAARLQAARMQAVMRLRPVGIRFVPGSPVIFRMYVDGNRNGIRTADVLSGADPPLGDDDVVANLFAGVDFGLLPDLPPVDPSSPPPGTDAVKFGTSNIASFSPNGSSSTGSVYLLSKGQQQYVVRLFGDTGKVRILMFDPRTRKWKPL